MDETLDGQVEHLQATVATLLDQVAALSVTQMALLREFSKLRERNRAMEMAVAASVAMLHEAISEPFDSLPSETEQTPS